MPRILRKVKVEFPETKKPFVGFNLSAKLRVLNWYSRFRGWEYDGYLVVILDSEGEVLQTKSDLSWLDDEELEKLRQLKPYQFFDEDCKKRSAPRLQYWSGRSQ